MKIFGRVKVVFTLSDIGICYKAIFNLGTANSREEKQTTEIH